MCDLSEKLEGKTALEIAEYFSCKVIDIRTAIFLGAKTYQDIYDYLKNKED